MSFTHTTAQIAGRSKTVTRRTRWQNLTAGTRLWAVERAQGLRAGERHNRLALIEVTCVTREPLDAITPAEVTAEGYPGRTPEWFIAMFTSVNGGSPDQTITRIQFTYHDHQEGFHP